MYAFESFLSIVSVWRTSTGSCAAGIAGSSCSFHACAPGVRAQLGVVLLPARPLCDGALRTRSAEAFALVAAAVFILYLPWVPTLLSQAKHTGAPWSTKPSFHELFTAVGRGARTATRRSSRSSLLRRRGWPCIPAASNGRSEFSSARPFCSRGCLRRSHRRGRRATSPSSSARSYCSPPRQSCAAAGSARRAGRDALRLVGLQRQERQGERQADRRLNSRLRCSRGSSSSRRTRSRCRSFATTSARRPPVGDDAGAGSRTPQVFDWRDAVTRLNAAKPRRDTRSAAGNGARGGRVRRRRARLSRLPSVAATWTNLVWRRSVAWSTLLQHDRRVHLERHFIDATRSPSGRNYFKPVQAFVYRRVG